MVYVQKARFRAFNCLVWLTITCLSAPSFAMENSSNPVQNAAIRVIVSHKENIFKALQADIANPTYKYISFDEYIFTNQQLAKALNAAQENGAHIEGTIGTHCCNKQMDTYFDEHGITVQKKPHNHLKRFLLSEKDPNIGSPGKNIVITGSANASNYAYHSHEVLTRTENDKEFFTQHYKNHVSLVQASASQVSSKQILTDTPEKTNRLVSSDEYTLNASKALRIKTLIKSKNKDRTLYITSMNWNSQEMTQAVINAHTDGITVRVIVNKTALTGSGKEQLAQMHKAQVPLYVYDAGANNRTLLHSKIMLRIDGEKYLLINSTANITAEGDAEHNVDAYHNRDNEEACKGLHAELEKLLAHNACKTYAQAIITLASLEKTKKRLFDDKENIPTQQSQNKKIKK